jgi:hypothetical protein
MDEQFSPTVRGGSQQEQFKNRVVIKAYEIANYLVEKRKTLDLSTPSSDLVVFSTNARN